MMILERGDSTTPTLAGNTMRARALYTGDDAVNATST